MRTYSFPGAKGLAAALTELVQAWQKQTGLAAICQVHGAARLPEAAEQALFRITQEALANVARHSGANAASVSLTLHPAPVVLEISDNGRGFDVDAPRAGLGLRSMQERARALGGQFRVESGAHGTRLTVVVPETQEAPA